jgi:hypothetical protein
MTSPGMMSGMEDRQEHGKYDPHQSLEIEESNVNSGIYEEDRKRNRIN